MNSKCIMIIGLLCIVSSCNTSTKKVTKSSDYNNYLELAENKTLQNAQEEHDFWAQKYEKQPTQFSYLSKIAASYSHLFATTGKIEYLKLAETKLIEVNKITHYSNPGKLMSLSVNYISQHKFKEALELLTKAELIGHPSTTNE